MNLLRKRKIAAVYRQARDLADDLPEIDQLCFVKTREGFHIQDPIFVTPNVASLQECFLLCLRINMCLSGNFVDYSPHVACMLHTSNADVLNHAAIPNSVYFEFSCDQKPRITTRFVDKFSPPMRCGVAMSETKRDRNVVSRQKRIVAGFETHFYSQPWYGWVLQDNHQICGVSLIARNPNDKATIWAISAAHCFIDVKKGRNILPQLKHFKFLFGVQDARIATPHITLRMAKRITVRPEYSDDKTSINDDVALIEFYEEIIFTAYVLPICLPYPMPDFDTWLNSAMCYICGFGSTEDRFPFALLVKHQPDRLRCIVSRAKRLYKGDSVLIEISVDVVYQGASKGDSGGGYVCRYNEENSPAVLMGIINGRKVGQYKYYEYRRLVYYYYLYVAFVPFYLEWLYNKTDQVADAETGSFCSKCWKQIYAE